MINCKMERRRKWWWCLCISSLVKIQQKLDLQQNMTFNTACISKKKSLKTNVKTIKKSHVAISIKDKSMHSVKTNLGGGRPHYHHLQCRGTELHVIAGLRSKSVCLSVRLCCQRGDSLSYESTYPARNTGLLCGQQILICQGRDLGESD